jgi:hypothetical protein
MAAVFKMVSKMLKIFTQYVKTFCPFYFFRAYFWKNIALLNSLSLSVHPSVCPPVTYFFAIISTYDLQILDSKRKLSIYKVYGWVFRSKAQELLDWAQIRPSQTKVFSLYFINFWETINVFQLISRGYIYSKIQIFQKKFFLGSFESSW